MMMELTTSEGNNCETAATAHHKTSIAVLNSSQFIH